MRMQRALDPEHPKTRSIVFRAPDPMFEALVGVAEARGTTVSALLRTLAERELKRERLAS
jgi:hypothetical protein